MEILDDLRKFGSRHRRSPSEPVLPKPLRILLPAVLILVWLVAASFGGPTFGKLSSVSSNDQASFLPANAESTLARELQQKFTDSRALPAIVLLVNNAGISKEDLPEYAALTSKLQQIAGVQASPGGGVAGPIPSKDGKAVEFIVPVGDAEGIKAVMAELRSTVAANLPSGAVAYVTGPAGLTADLVSAFAGIDGILLLVALIAVFVILLLVYRSLILPLLVLLTSVCALTASILVVYAFASWGWIKLSGQSQGILSILVIGAATDYALLLVARFREALHHAESKWTALSRALRGALEPIAASAATVILALLCLLISDLNSNRSLGPIAAIGIFFALLGALTFLPALLAVFGRAAFWPFRPKADDVGGAQQIVTGLEGLSPLWRRTGSLVSRRPRLVWAVSLVVLLACGAGLFQLKANGVAQTDLILRQSEAVDGQRAQALHFDAGTGSPAVVVVPSDRAQAALDKVKATPGVASATFYTGASGPAVAAGGTAPPAPLVRDGRMLINATLAAEADSDAAEQVVRNLRQAVPQVAPGALVGGVTATALDTNETAQRDLARIIPIVLGVILLILMLLLRSVVAPLLLIGSVVLSYAAALGVSALVFNHLFNFPGADASVPLFGFVFLVALGVDYNIFLMTRVREESQVLGTRRGILRGLGATGGVITSAGIVLAATFAALGVIPILFLAQIAFIVAFGVLLDTVLVRSLLVPALAYDAGSAIWWPSKLRFKQ